MAIREPHYNVLVGSQKVRLLLCCISSLQCMIYLLVKLPRITTLLNSEQLRETLAFLHMPDAVELDPLFDPNRNIDYNNQGGGGVSRMEFIYCYHEFIQFCKQKHLPSDVREKKRERGGSKKEREREREKEKERERERGGREREGRERSLSFALGVC